MDQFLQQIINGIQQGSIYALIALGYTMVYGVLGLINFAHGDVFMIGSFVGFYTAKAMRLSEKATFGEAMLALLPVLIVTMIVCAILGLLIERVAYRPLRKASRLTALITAIGVSLLLANSAQLLFGADPKFYPSVTPQGEDATVMLGKVTMAKDQMVLVGAAIVLMAILWYIVNRTKVGQAMRAVQHDTQAAALMGINVDGVISFTFGLGAALAGAAGMLFGAFTYSQVFPLLGVQMGLKAFVAAVVGGIGSIPGAVVGGLLMGLSESFVKGAPKILLPGGGAFEPSRFTDAVAFVLLIVILLLRPAGLLGKFAPEKV
ncbi:MAG: branched-chain amino acid ABC transporter permease [Akkermansiaceae bacterium]|nr:branched-chain amino acid ABC transporter permease [Armatimonadota bacterium]